MTAILYFKSVEIHVARSSSCASWRRKWWTIRACTPRSARIAILSLKPHQLIYASGAARHNACLAVRLRSAPILLLKVRSRGSPLIIITGVMIVFKAKTRKRESSFLFPPIPLIICDRASRRSDIMETSLMRLILSSLQAISYRIIRAERSSKGVCVNSP